MKKHRLKLNGKWVTPSEFHRSGPVGGVGIPAIPATCSSAKPRVSESMGVLPHQVPVERAKLRELQHKGELTGVNIRNDGAVEYTCNGEQGAIGWQRYRGNKVNLDGGYSDTYTPDDRFGAKQE